MNFCLLKSLSKNKATVDDEFILDGKKRIVTSVTSEYVHLNDKTYYPRLMLNRWIRLHYRNITHKTVIANREANLKKTICAWKDTFNPGSFIPQSNHYSFLLFESSKTINHTDPTYLFYFATNKDVDTVDLLTSFKNDCFNKPWASEYNVLSSGKYLSLPYSNEDDRPFIVIFPSFHAIQQEIIDVYNDSYAIEHFIKLAKQ